jgi:protease-4
MDYQNENTQNNSEKNGKRGSFWKIFWGIFTGFSVLVNIILVLLLISMVAVAITKGGVGLIEKQVRKGDAESKIAVINIRGVIDDENFVKFEKQIKTAQKDKAVKGLIIRINSPGGSVSASDRIYHEIRKYRSDTNKPAVAFMQQLAASGGYYAAAGCEQIVAEPTAITGSIGVISGYAVVQGLLEEKLGITPVIVKAGEKKDWPSSFRPASPEQKEYLQERLVQPAYQRFVEIIDDSREQLTAEEVKKIADGSIYQAQQALELKLIDDVGYMDKAIETAEKSAGIENAKVVEYEQPFSLKQALSPSFGGAFNIDSSKIFELATPKIMYLWTI